MAYAIGPVSGCHINPAVTLGVVMAGRMPKAQAGGYILAQIAGAILAALVLLVPEADVAQGFASLTVVPALTDNQSKGRVLNKLMSTKFPLCAILMEIAAQLHIKHQVLQRLL